MRQNISRTEKLASSIPLKEGHLRNRTVRAKAEGVEYPTLKGKTVRQVRFANDEDFSAIVIEFDDNTLVSFRLKANIALSMEPELSITKGGNIISWKTLKARPVVRRARRVFHAAP